MPLDLARDTIFVTLAGSQAHGTARPQSDVDLRGVCVAPMELRVSLFRSFEQSDGPLDGELWEILLRRLEQHPTARHGLAVKTESVIFDVAKFLSLCASANPNALEILFADERDWVYQTPAWQAIHQERYRFLSRKVQQTYLGYAMAQLKRIRTHRDWLFHPPARKPTREDFGLPEAGSLSREDQHCIEQAIAERIRSYGIDTLEMPKPLRVALSDRIQSLWCDALKSQDANLEDAQRAAAVAGLGLPKDVVNALNAERRYRAAMRHWEAYASWKSERNPARAELEMNFGYDTKHAMHLIRLMRSGLELLTQGELQVRRLDANELIAIRDGKLSFDEVLSLAAELETQMQKAVQSNQLPREIDLEFVDQLALRTILG